MFNWLRRKKAEQIAHTNLPGLLLEVEENGNILISASWPDVHNNNEYASVYKRMVGLLLMLHSGKIIPGFPEAILRYGSNHGENEVAEGICAEFSKYLEQIGDESKPVVSPSEAFHRE